MKHSIGNSIKLLVFIGCIGAICSLVLWLFLLAVNKGTWLLWDVLPSATGNFVWYPAVICTIGGLIIGLFRKKFGDYPQGMMEVFGTLKKTKTYPYRKILIILIAAILPLIFASSVGPEAGMVGIITALCCWAGENLKFAKSKSAEYTEIGASVTLAVLFHAPLFGIFHMVENEDDSSKSAAGNLSKGQRIIIYVIAAAAAIGIFKQLNAYVCDVSMGFPSFETSLPEAWDYLIMFLYMAAGIFLGLFFEWSEKGFNFISSKLPPVISELLAGLVLGVVIIFIPYVKFSGEEQMGTLIQDYALYPAIALIAMAFIKILVTNMCIQLGLKGGHFFPLIFAAVCLGYGISLLVWPGMESHAVFAAAITAAATLGFTLKKPLAVTMLLFLCFPIRMVFWILLSAALASAAGGWRPGNKLKQKRKVDNGDA